VSTECSDPMACQVKWYLLCRQSESKLSVYQRTCGVLRNIRQQSLGTSPSSSASTRVGREEGNEPTGRAHTGIYGLPCSYLVLNYCGHSCSESALCHVRWFYKVIWWRRVCSSFKFWNPTGRRGIKMACENDVKLDIRNYREEGEEEGKLVVLAFTQENADMQNIINFYLLQLI